MQHPCRSSPGFCCLHDDSKKSESLTLKEAKETIIIPVALRGIIDIDLDWVDLFPASPASPVADMENDNNNDHGNPKTPIPVEEEDEKDDQPYSPTSPAEVTEEKSVQNPMTPTLLDESEQLALLEDILVESRTVTQVESNVVPPPLEIPSVPDLLDLTNVLDVVTRETAAIATQYLLDRAAELSVIKQEEPSVKVEPVNPYLSDPNLTPLVDQDFDQDFVPYRRSYRRRSRSRSRMERPRRLRVDYNRCYTERRNNRVRRRN